jgi:hypothetical protein
MKRYPTFCKESCDSYPEITDEEIADELFKAKDLSSYATTTSEAMRHCTHEQAEDNYYKQEENNKVFSEQLEAQRHEIVETVEDINDIGGASISSEMKEYLLHDIMELNDNRDPILMEKLFEVLRLCLANWF